MRKVSLALGLRSTPQSLGIIGRELGAFAEQGIEMCVVREETAGPDGARGLLSGEYEFAEFGAVPIVQAAIEGHDPLILLAAEQVSALYILARRDIAAPPHLAGGAIGVLSGAGQTGFSATKMLERWSLSDKVQVKALGTYPKIYAALAAGEIDAGVLTADYKITGGIAYGFRALADLGQEFKYQGPVVATTRRLRDREPATVAAVVAGYVRAIQMFKTMADRVAPVLRNHLGFVDDAQAQAIQRFYAARFQDVPLPSPDGIGRVIQSFVKTHPAAATLRVETLYDPSFVNATIAARE
jgi:ABC-type nitrate/sulfonate/bicarbonate transport system substrate-binding protein